MYASFFLSRRWAAWAYPGIAVIVGGAVYIVQVKVWINQWFKEFFDLIQKALAEPGAVQLNEFFGFLATFGQIAGIYIVVAVLLGFFTKHWIFRWRTAMNNFYMERWQRLRHIEGAAQRVQEDTRLFANYMENVGSGFVDAVLTLLAFLPILWMLSKGVTELPWVGAVDHSLIYVAVLFALFGTVVLAAVGIKLPGLEFRNQRVEAAYRKELVYGEDHEERADLPTANELFGNVRRNYFRLFLHYMYFDIAKWSYLQFGILVPYIALAPTIVAGAITFGVMQQILHAFSQVETSFQFLVRSWTLIVELISVYKRLRAFEAALREEEVAPADRVSS